MNRSRLLAASVAALVIAAPVAAWEPQELPTAQSRLEEMDRALLPLHGSLMGALEERWTEATEDAFLTIIQARAVQAWEIVRRVQVDPCFQQYAATLLVGFALVADGVDSYRANDQVFRSQVDSGIFLIGDAATLEREFTTCDPNATPEPAPSEDPA